MNNIQHVQSELIRIQKHQMDHDEFYHREIARLSIGARLQHMALHISKYFSRIVIGSMSSQVDPKAWIDTFIISTSTANILNVRLFDLWSSVIPAQEGLILNKWIDQLHKNILENKSDELIYAVANLEFSNAAEKIDHIESFDYRKAIARSVGELSIVSASKFISENQLFESVSQRLKETKVKNIFHGE